MRMPMFSRCNLLFGDEVHVKQHAASGFQKELQVLGLMVTWLETHLENKTCASVFRLGNTNFCFLELCVKFYFSILAKKWR